MPDFTKPSLELVNFYTQTMQDFPQATQRLTFGSPCAYINGHMAVGLHGNSMFLRLNPKDESEFLDIPGATAFMPMQGRPMKGYVVVPERLRASEESLHGWIARSLDYVATLPPKEKKPAGKKK